MHRGISIKTFCHGVLWDELHGIEAQFLITLPIHGATGTIRQEFCSIDESTNFLEGFYLLA